MADRKRVIELLSGAVADSSYRRAVAQLLIALSPDPHIRKILLNAAEQQAEDEEQDAKTLRIVGGFPRGDRGRLVSDEGGVRGEG